MAANTSKSKKPKLPPNLYWRGDKIWIKYQSDGKQHRESTGTVSVTKALEYLRKHQERVDKIASGQQIDVKFDYAMLNFLKEKKPKLRPRAYNNYTSYAKKISEFFSGKLLSDIGRGAIKEYINYRKSFGATDGVIIKELKCLSTMFGISIEYELCNINPVSLIKFKKSLNDYKERTRYLSPEEYQKLIKAANEPLKSIMIFNVETGLRIGELLKLTYDDLNTQNKERSYITISAQSAKNKTSRIVPLSKIALAQILAQPKSGISNNIFNKIDGSPYAGNPKDFL